MKLQSIVLPFYLLPAILTWEGNDKSVLLKNLSAIHIKLKDSYKIDSVKKFGRHDPSNYIYFTVDESDKKDILQSLKKQTDFEAFKKPYYDDFLTTKNTGRIYQSTYIFKHFSQKKKKSPHTTVYTFSIDTITNKAELDSYYY